MSTGAIDPAAYREALSHFASGVTVISGLVEGEPVGFTCQSFHSVSLDPPLVSFSVMRTSKSWPKLRSVGSFAINVLSADQSELSNEFAKSTGDRWAKVRWTTSPNNSPLIHDALLWLDCGIYSEVEAGDHSIVVSRVHHLLWDSRARSPLIFYKGAYRQLTAV